jgi:glycine oxidase
VDGPLWDALLTDDDRRVLDPGPPSQLDTTPDVLVVGGGVAGLATAVFCRRAGVQRVVVVERDRLAAGPSGRAAGTLTPGIHAMVKPDAFVELASRGLELHRELDEEWDGAAGFRTIDSLVALPIVPPQELLDRAAARLVDAVTAHELEPELGDVEHAVHLPRQGAVPPLAFARELARRAGQLASRVEVLDVETTNGRVTRVHTSQDDVSPGAVVFATATTERLPTPQRRVKGHMLATEPAPFRLRTLPAGLVGLVQVAEGHIVVGGTFEFDDPEPDVRETVVETILAELHRILPRTKDLVVAHRWTCFRPSTFDELPLIDRVPGLDNAWANVGHFRTGILVAPAAGALLASWITTGDRPALAEGFGEDRAPHPPSVTTEASVRAEGSG